VEGDYSKLTTGGVDTLTFAEFSIENGGDRLPAENRDQTHRQAMVPDVPGRSRGMNEGVEGDKGKARKRR